MAPGLQLANISQMLLPYKSRPQRRTLLILFIWHPITFLSAYPLRLLYHTVTIRCLQFFLLDRHTMLVKHHTQALRPPIL